MPTLADWMCHYPSDWTPRQARAFANTVLIDLSHRIQPVNMALGPSQTVAILSTIIVTMARQNPLYARDINDKLANAFALIEDIDPLPEETTVKQ